MKPLREKDLETVSILKLDNTLKCSLMAQLLMQIFQHSYHWVSATK